MKAEKRGPRGYDALDPSLFKAFMAAAEAENFTRAAAAAAMTQSGVSQQVARLEGQIGVPLFRRVNQAVRLTEAGRKLRSYISGYVDGVDALLDELREEHGALAGKVSYAMPHACLYTPHLAMLLATRRTRFPGIELEVFLAPDARVLEMVASGEVDFGFVTAAMSNRALRWTPFCREEYVLACTDKKVSTEAWIAKPQLLSLIHYPGEEVYFERWWRAAFPKARLRSFDDFSRAAKISTLDRALRMLSAGLGAAFIPRHCLEALEPVRLHVAVPRKGWEGAFGEVHIVQPGDVPESRRVRAVVHAFLEMK